VADFRAESTCTFVGAFKASMERLEGQKILSIPRFVRARSGFDDSRSVLVKEHGEGGIVRTQEVIK